MPRKLLKPSDEDWPGTRTNVKLYNIIENHPDVKMWQQDGDNVHTKMDYLAW